MGNTNPKPNATTSHSVGGVNAQIEDSLHQINSGTRLPSSFSGRSFNSVCSQQSTYSHSRPWSRTSRRRWKQSTLTLPYELSKTAWPVSRLESLFLPDFPINPSVVSEHSFDVLEEISHGAFGKVYKVQEKKSEIVYALKVLSKSQIVKEDAVGQVKNEVHIQRVCGHHTFIVNCPYHWQSRKRLYIVSDYVEGGELYKLLKTYCILPIVLVQLYIAEIALALDFLHNAGIVHRDLKPENVLLDGDGHTQLIDFGLAKWLPYGSKTSRVCGTLRYMAPEVVGLQPYGHAADWWSLGVIACLMLTGKQDEFKVIFERIEIVDYNTSFLRFAKTHNFKYNRTNAVTNMTFGIKQDLFEKRLQAYKFTSNEYRLFPIRFSFNFCEYVHRNEFGLGELYRCGNLSDCPFKKGTHFVCNWTANSTKFPSHIPQGNYMLDLKLFYRETVTVFFQIFGIIKYPEVKT